jgi:glucosamine-6-phosphate deaminase
MAQWDDAGIEFVITQGGIGDTGHFAFNDPVPQEGPWVDRPPTANEYAEFHTRIVPLHPWTIAQDARHSTGGDVSLIPSMAVTVGPREVLGRSKRLSFWCPGHHSPAIVIWMLAWMIANDIQDSRMPQSLFARHPDVTYHLLRPKIVPPGIDVH